MFTSLSHSKSPGNLTAIKLNAVNLTASLRIPVASNPEEAELSRLSLLDGPIPNKSAELLESVRKIKVVGLPEVAINFGNNIFHRLKLSEVIEAINNLASNLNRSTYEVEKTEFPCLAFHRSMFGLFGAATLLCKANQLEWPQFCAPQNETSDRMAVQPKMPNRPLFILENSLSDNLDGLAINCAELSKLLRVFCDPNAFSSFGRGLDLGLQAIGYIASFPPLSSSRSTSEEPRVRLSLTSGSRIFNDSEGAWPKLIELATKKVAVKYSPGLLNQVEVCDLSAM